MAKWLTTGQMIDQIKVGEIAKSTKHGLAVIKTREGRIENASRKDGHLVLNFHTTDIMWQIIPPKYVSFEDAIKALKDGFAVKYEAWWGWQEFSKSADVNTLDNTTWADLINGKWIVVEK